MYNISSIKENGEMMLNVTPESYFANLVVQNCFFFICLNVLCIFQLYMYYIFSGSLNILVNVQNQ